jgi:hypothetical protein
MVILESLFAYTVSGFIMSEVVKAHARKFDKKRKEAKQEESEDDHELLQHTSVENKEDSMNEKKTARVAIVKDDTGEARLAIVFDQCIEPSSLSSIHAAGRHVEIKKPTAESKEESNNERLKATTAVVEDSDYQLRLVIVFDECIEPSSLSSRHIQGMPVEIAMTG